MRQRFGQNFLIDKNIAQKIVAAAALSPEDTVLEIGPGKGVLTGLIAPLVKELWAVEIDAALAGTLQQRFAHQPRVHVVRSDALAFPMDSLPPGSTVVSNLPYYLATAILEKILPSRAWRSAVVMVQKEVGERIVAEPGTRDYGAFTLIVRYFARAEIVMKVGPESFFPRPQVDSMLVRLINTFPPEPAPELFPMVRLAFQQRRKTILNSLSRALDCPKEALRPVLERSRIDPSLRPERITLEQYKILTSNLKKDIIYDGMLLPKTPKNGKKNILKDNKEKTV